VSLAETRAGVSAPLRCFTAPSALPRFTRAVALAEILHYVDDFTPGRGRCATLILGVSPRTPRPLRVRLVLLANTDSSDFSPGERLTHPLIFRSASVAQT